MIAGFVMSLGGCEDQAPSGAPSAKSAPTPPAVSTPAPAATPPASAAAAPPSASAAPSGPVHDCPTGSTGDGTLSKPCEATGKARMMEATWTGKITDGGPSFKVINKSKSVILYGKIVVYFYDKAGKQLEVKGSDGKPHPNQVCAGNLFGGVMKAGEKATMDNFSCVKKEIVPEGAAAIEAEMQMVGFADQTEKKSEYYWRNNDLTPDTRPKGGVK